MKPRYVSRQTTPLKISWRSQTPHHMMQTKKCYAATAWPCLSLLGQHMRNLDVVVPHALLTERADDTPMHTSPVQGKWHAGCKASVRHMARLISITTHGKQLARHPFALCHTRNDHLESSNLRGNVIILVKLGCLLQLGLHIIQRLLHLHMGCP